MRKEREVGTDQSGGILCASDSLIRVVRKMADARRWMRSDAARRWRRLGAGPLVAEGPRTVTVVSLSREKENV